MSAGQYVRAAVKRCIQGLNKKQHLWSGKSGYVLRVYFSTLPCVIRTELYLPPALPPAPLGSIYLCTMWYFSLELLFKHLFVRTRVTVKTQHFRCVESGAICMVLTMFLQCSQSCEGVTDDNENHILQLNTPWWSECGTVQSSVPFQPATANTFGYIEFTERSTIQIWLVFNMGAISVVLEFNLEKCSYLNCNGSTGLKSHK